MFCRKRREIASLVWGVAFGLKRSVGACQWLIHTVSGTTPIVEFLKIQVASNQKTNRTGRGFPPEK